MRNNCEVLILSHRNKLDIVLNFFSFQCDIEMWCFTQSSQSVGHTTQVDHKFVQDGSCVESSYPHFLPNESKSISGNVPGDFGRLFQVVPDWEEICQPL